MTHEEAHAFSSHGRCPLNPRERVRSAKPDALRVTIVNGLAGIPGEMFFDLDYDVTALPVNLYRGCRYFYEWSSCLFLPLSAEGLVIEAKAHAASSCVRGQRLPRRAERRPDDPTCISTGFDRFGQFRTLALLSLGESVLDGSLPDGLVAFGGAVGISPPTPCTTQSPSTPTDDRPAAGALPPGPPRSPASA